MMGLIIMSKLVAAKISIQLICAGNSYMMLDESKDYKKNCQRFIVFDDYVLF